MSEYKRWPASVFRVFVALEVRDETVHHEMIVALRSGPLPINAEKGVGW